MHYSVCFKFSCYAFDPSFHCWLDLENMSELFCILNYMDTALILETVKLVYKQNDVLFVEHSLLDICASNIKAQNKLYNSTRCFCYTFQIKIAIEPGAFHYISVRSYKVKTIKGGIYVRSRKFIRIRHTDLRQSLESIPRDTEQSESTTYTDRPRRTTRRPQRLIEWMNFIWTRYTQRRFV